MMVNTIFVGTAGALLTLSSSSSALVFLDNAIAAPPPSHGISSMHQVVGIVVDPSCSTPPWPTSSSSSSSSSSSFVPWPSVQLAAASTTSTTAHDDVPPPHLPNPCARYDTADDIPPSSYASHDVIRGRVVRVIDGDTIRIRHVPACAADDPAFAPSPDAIASDSVAMAGSKCDTGGRSGGGGRRLTECTVIVRLYGVDAPEISMRKKKGGVGGGDDAGGGGGGGGGVGQPYSREATEYVIDRAYDKIVNVKVLGRDRYDRVIGRVTIGGGEGGEEEDLSYGLLGRGYATLYTGGGAKYDGRRIEMEGMMEKARDDGLGIWGMGLDVIAE